MGGISIIARRLEGGQRVQYGWAGNGGYYSSIGRLLNNYYSDEDVVEALFDLGQLLHLGLPGSENGGYNMMETHALENKPHWLGKSEREIFSKIAFVDFGYFYDLDKRWHYVIPGPFRIKIPLEYYERHLDDRGYEFDENRRISIMLMEYIFTEYCEQNSDFKEYIEENYKYGIPDIRNNIVENKWPIHEFYEKYQKLFRYFDDWVVVVPSDDMQNISQFNIKKNMGDDRVETIYWKAI